MNNNLSTPPGDPRDSRNLFMAIILSLSVLLGWQYFFEAPRQAKLQAAREAEIASTGPVTTPVAAPGSPAGATLPAVARPRAEVVAEGQRLRINTDRLHGSLNLTGARFDDLTLARYKETLEPNSPEITLLSPAAAEVPYYAEFGWQGQGVKLPDATTTWKVVSGALEPGKGPLVLHWDNGEGLSFERSISLDDNYMFAVTQKVTNKSGADVTLHPYGVVARTFDPAHKGMFIQHEGAIGVYDNKLHEDTYKNMVSDKLFSRSSTGGWFGFTDKYWLVALIPDQQQAVNVRSFHAPQVADTRFQVDYMGPAITVAAGTSVESTSHLFAGAKEVRLLDAYEASIGVPHLDLAIDFGWYYFLTKPFFYSLDILAGWFGNFGLAILAFTVVVKLLLFPLADHSYRSMAKMKLVAPKIQDMRERYKDDMQRQSQEMMALYKKEGINPLSGCWPVLIQIPIFFSLYKVLYVSIEMRHAPFYGWITDLSGPDSSNLFTLFGLLSWTPPSVLHLGILPILMGITMWLQFKMNPPPTDPVQKTMFSLMPFILTITMSTFAAGLLIYWTWSNILSILQQYVLMKRMHVKAF